MQLIIAEKPSVGRDLGRVLGVKGGSREYLEGADKVITWCIGHLVELEEPATYDPAWKAWSLSTLPMIPPKFLLRPTEQTLAQFKVVKSLLQDKRFTEVINACDAGREGELIFRYVYELSGSKLPMKRLWISSLTDEAIKHGFSSLKSGSQFDGLFDAARCRSEADWLVGMNATRGMTARSRNGAQSTLYSIGRVQTPTLAILVHREKEILNFVSKEYWEVKGTFLNASQSRFTATWQMAKQSRFGTKDLAAQVAARDKALGAATDPKGPRVESLQKKTLKEPPPLLFDLTLLQQTANRRFGFTSAQTLELAQALYETHKVLTYPRTGSRFLSNDIAKDLSRIFTALQPLPEYAAFVTSLLGTPPTITKRVFDDAKVSDHHAIIPTGKPVRLDALSSEERCIFDVVVRRFLGAFYPDAEFEQTELTIRVGGPTAPKPTETTPFLEVLPPLPDLYITRGRVRAVVGWQTVAGIDPEDEEKKDANEQSLPSLQVGEALEGRFEVLSKKTTPPSRYTEATLLSAMEFAGKQIEDEALRQAMKDGGLGTPATRASTIETLITRDYILREKKQVKPTPTGMALIDAVPVESLRSPELTGSWEARLARMSRNEETRTAFMKDIAEYVQDMVDKIKTQAAPVASAPSSGATTGSALGPCPKCGGQVHIGNWNYPCEKDCGFSVPKKLAQKVLSESVVSTLLKKKRTQPVKGFVSKLGKKFEAVLVLTEAHELKFVFEEKRASKG
jgi:DNA topoisomerase III